MAKKQHNTESSFAGFFGGAAAPEPANKTPQNTPAPITEKPIAPAKTSEEKPIEPAPVISEEPAKKEEIAPKKIKQEEPAVKVHEEPAPVIEKTKSAPAQKAEPTPKAEPKKSAQISDGEFVKEAAKKETRDKSLLIKLTPTLLAEVKAKCARIGVNQNEALNQVLQHWIDIK